MVRISRTSVLVVVLAVALLATLPAAVHRLIQSRDPYLFTHRFFIDLWARFTGMGRIRFILQPLIALLISRHDGLRDAEKGRPPFLSGLIFRYQGQPRHSLRGAAASIGNLLIVAILMDLLFQFLIFREVHPLAALLIGPLLIAAPYAVGRAWTNRFARWRLMRKTAS